MTKILIRPYKDFGLAAMDRAQMTSTFDRSFFGDIEFKGENGTVKESNVPIIYLACSLIEAYVVTSLFGSTNWRVPVPSSGRDVIISKSVDGMRIESIEELGGDRVGLNIIVNEDDIRQLATTILTIFRSWRPPHIDELLFVRRHWFLDFIMETISRDN